MTIADFLYAARAIPFTVSEYSTNAARLTDLAFFLFFSVLGVLVIPGNTLIVRLKSKGFPARRLVTAYKLLTWLNTNDIEAHGLPCKDKPSRGAVIY